MSCVWCCVVFFSSRRRHTMCALVTGVQTCALPISGELKIGQVGITNLRVRTLDVARLAAEMADRVKREPKLFARAAVIVDFGGLPGTPDAATARALDRKSVGEGKRVSVRVELGGRRIIKKKKNQQPKQQDTN